MNKFKNIIDTLKYLPIVATALLAQELEGQDIWGGPPSPMPTEKINMFISPDTTPQAVAYDAATSQTEKNNIIQSRIDPDWISTVGQWVWNTYPNGMPPPEYPYWGCGNAMYGLMINSINFEGEIYGLQGFQDDRFLFNKYSGFNLDSILKNQGSLRDKGKLGLPMYTVGLTDPVTMPGGHGMNAVLTGNDITNWESWTFVEPQFDQINVQLGQAYMPRNCGYFMIDYWYLYNRSDGKKEIKGIPIAFFTIKDGIPKFEGLNPYITDLIITERESDRPIINVKSTSDQDSLLLEINEKNYKKGELIIDGGAPVSISQIEKRKLGLTPGTHNLQIKAEDYFRLVSDTTFQRTITTSVNAPPIITFIAPENGKTYDNDISFQYNITDTDFDKATYRIDNGTKISASQSGTIPLTLSDGLHKIVIEATDKKPQTTKDSVSFEMKKTTAIESSPTSEDKVTLYPMPAGDFVNIKTLSSTSKVIFRTLYDVSGRQVYNDEIEVNLGEDINRLDISNLSKGVYYLRTVEQGSNGNPRTYNIVKF